MELIYEFNRNLFEAAQKKETYKSIEAKRHTRTILEVLYTIGNVDYVNIVTQSDEIS